MRIHHIGYLVRDMGRAREAFLRLGYEDVSGVVPDALRRVELCFLQKDGCTVELVCSAGPDSAVAGLVKRYQNAPYHLCYEAERFDADLAALERDGYTRMDDPAPAPAFGGRRVVFLMSPAVGILELIEEPCSSIK